MSTVYHQLNYECLNFITILLIYIDINIYCEYFKSMQMYTDNNRSEFSEDSIDKLIGEKYEKINIYDILLRQFCLERESGELHP